MSLAHLQMFADEYWNLLYYLFFN